mgnify:CR=1 FL=1
MKKALLLGAAVLVAAQYTNAELTPTKMEDAQFTCISPDGKMAGSDLMGHITLVNPQTGEVLYSYPETQDDMTAYTLSNGNGQGISNTGVVLCTRYDGDVCWWKAGEFHSLVPLVTDDAVSNGVNGITPDGLTICGYCGLKPMSTDDILTPMSVPVIYKLKSDGTYTEAIQLPYPERDFTGRVPQYVIATNISADGRVIAGQVLDYSGAMPQPIVWKLKDNDTWEYETLGIDLLNPDHVVFPQFPDIEPRQPQAQDFMSPDGLEEYNEAYQSWAASGYTGEMPEYTDYMTPEELAAYNAAMAKYNEEMAVYQPLADAFNEVWYSFLESGKSTFFVFNSTSLSPDGKLLLQMEQKEIPGDDPWSSETKFGTSVFNLENGKYKSYGTDRNIMPSQILADGTVLGSVQDGMIGTRRATIYKPADWNSDAAPEFSWLDEYVKTINPGIYDWMKTNMCGDVIGMDPETWEEITIEDVWYTGFPLATPDMNTIVSTQENTFDWNTEAMAFGFCLPLHETSGIRDVAGEGSMTVMAQRGGLLELQGVRDVKVYDAQGRLVYSAAGVNGSVETGLKGVCIVRATGLDSDARTLKVNF